MFFDHTWLWNQQTNHQGNKPTWNGISHLQHTILHKQHGPRILSTHSPDASMISYSGFQPLRLLNLNVICKCNSLNIHSKCIHIIPRIGSEINAALCPRVCPNRDDENQVSNYGLGLLHFRAYLVCKHGKSLNEDVARSIIRYHDVNIVFNFLLFQSHVFVTTVNKNITFFTLLRSDQDYIAVPSKELLLSNRSPN